MNKINLFLTFLPLAFLISCGSSGGDGGSKVIEGQLTEGVGDAHTESRIKHGVDEPIEEVEVCSLGRCSKTDSQGMFGFSVSDDFKGGDILLTVAGHETNSEIVINFPENVSTLFVHLERHSSTEVEIHHLIHDGVTVDLSHADEHTSHAD